MELSQSNASDVGMTVREIPMGKVLPWQSNPEDRLLRNAGFCELREHIRVHGQIDPVDVVVQPTWYQIVRGNRRYAALQDLGAETILCRVWPGTFCEVMAKLGPTERMHPNWSGRSLGQLVHNLGVDAALPLLSSHDQKVVVWAREHLSDDLVAALLRRFGPRVFVIIRRFGGGDPMRMAQAILLHGRYRDIEQKGLSPGDRELLIEQWLQEGQQWIGAVGRNQ